MDQVLFQVFPTLPWLWSNCVSVIKSDIAFQQVEGSCLFFWRIQIKYLFVVFVEGFCGQLSQNKTTWTEIYFKIILYLCLEVPLLNKTGCEMETERISFLLTIFDFVTLCLLAQERHDNRYQADMEMHPRERGRDERKEWKVRWCKGSGTAGWDQLLYTMLHLDFWDSDDLQVIAEPHPRLENHYIHPSPSISSPSGTGHEDPLYDWARAKAQQGGVKPAGMFHIHTQRE